MLPRPQRSEKSVGYHHDSGRVSDNEIKGHCWTAIRGVNLYFLLSFNKLWVMR